MELRNRMQLLRVLQKMEKQTQFSKKLALKNASHYKDENERMENQSEVHRDRSGNEPNC